MPIGSTTLQQEAWHKLPESKPKAIDLFAGIGGMHLGLIKAGFDVVYANDADPYCAKTYRQNFKTVDQRDIRTVKSSEIPDFHILAAGFPCQPFSVAGKKRGFDDPRGKLFFQVARIINDKKPEAFVLENVRHLRTHNEGKTLKTIIRTLTNLGYKVEHRVLNAIDFGLPQIRKRIFIVGFRNKSVDFLWPAPIMQTSLESILEPDPDQNSYLSQQYYECLVKHRERNEKKGNSFGYRVLDKKRFANALVTGGSGRERNLVKDTLPDKHYKPGLDKLNNYNREGLRRLTIRECARLQGFPDDFVFPVSKTQAYKQLANAVPVNIVCQIGLGVKESLFLNATN